jgi:cytochrome c553
MKKAIVGLLIFIFSISLLNAYTQEERIKDMKVMEAAMSQIQKGIIYNSKEDVLVGVKSLKEVAAKVEIAPKTALDYSNYFAKKQSANIIKFADKIKNKIEAGRKHSAAANYLKVLDQCISCHNKIRKWGQ